MEDDPAGSAQPPVKECTAPRTTDLNIKQGNDPAGSAKPPVKGCEASCKGVHSPQNLSHKN